MFSSNRSKIAAARSCSMSRLRADDSVFVERDFGDALGRSAAGIAHDGRISAAALIEPERQRERVGVEPFGLGEPDRRRRELAEARRVAADQRACAS